jgi:hypothetical protein
MQNNEHDGVWPQILMRLSAGLDDDPHTPPWIKRMKFMREGLDIYARAVGKEIEIVGISRSMCCLVR